MAKYDNFSRDELIELLQKQDKELARKKYGLVWDSEKEPEQVVLECAKKLPILKNITEKDIKTSDDDYNIMIEGDNYHALQVLNYTHKGKIDVIYIDPPYNTGEKDFIYNDKYIDKEDGYRHSKWLNFMEKRLDLAKDLLSNKGIIFISIDDNEQANLKLLCDKIFGEEKFIASLHVETSVIAGPRRVPAMQGSVVKTAEYVLCYIKGNDTKIFKNILYDYIPGFDTHYSIFLDKQQNKVIPFLEYIKRDEHISSVFAKAGIKISLDNLWKIISIDSQTMEKIYSDDISSNLYRKGDDENSIPDDITSTISYNSIFQYKDKFFLKGNDGKIKNIFRYKDRIGYSDDYFRSYGERTVRGNLWKGFSADGGNLAKEGGIDFKNGKKPIRLIKQLIKGVSKNFEKNMTILDFFAGSGTTAEAVLILNKEDGKKHNFILCTNNENNIAEEKTYPRIKTVITGLKQDGKDYNFQIPANLKYFKTDFIANSKNKTQTKINLAKQCSEMLCLKTGIYNLIDEGNLCFKLFDNNKHNKFLCVYFDFFGNNMQEFIHKIKSLNGEKFVFMFSLDENVDKSLFEGIENIKIEPIPQKILDVYKKIAKEHIKGDNHD